LDNSGVLNKDEFRISFRDKSSATEFDEDTFEWVWQQVDLDGSGTISADEYIDWLLCPPQPEQSEISPVQSVRANH
jgi:Ca2+-binding EF-hand superfamily protein